MIQLESIDGYRLLQPLGEGGMGRVYEALQTEPVRRHVALKVLRAGGGDAVVARFEAERQALALMDHPGIAKVFDAGVTEDGRQWLAMELVAGRPLTEYSDGEQLEVMDRAVVHAPVAADRRVAHGPGHPGRRNAPIRVE